MKGKLYGTLFDVPTMSTHVVCPICGKSSSMKSFPAGRGDELILQTFRGNGRGRGFSVVSRESGIDDRKLASALKPKVLDLVRAMASHGHVSRPEILEWMSGTADSEAAPSVRAGDAKTRELEAELTVEKRTRELLESEVTDLQLGLTKLLKQWRDVERRNVVSQRHQDEVRARTERIVQATREGVESLQRLRAEIKTTGGGAKELSDHARKMRAIVEAVQGLRVSQQIAPAGGREAHDAR